MPAGKTNAVFGSVSWWLVAQKIPNPDLGFLFQNISWGLILCQTDIAARLHNCAFSFIIIFRADLFLVDRGLFSLSLALPCSEQSIWQPTKDHAFLEVLSPASPNWWVQAWAKAAFVLSQLVAFSWAWMAQQKLLDALQGESSQLHHLCWKLCTLFWINLVVPAFFLFFWQGKWYGMGVEWGGVMHKTMQSALYHGGLIPSTRGEGTSIGEITLNSISET